MFGLVNTRKLLVSPGSNSVPPKNQAMLVLLSPPLVGDFSVAAPESTKVGAASEPRVSMASIPTVSTSMPGLALATEVIWYTYVNSLGADGSTCAIA